MRLAALRKVYPRAGIVLIASGRIAPLQATIGLCTSRAHIPRPPISFGALTPPSHMIDRAKQGVQGTVLVGSRRILRSGRKPLAVWGQLRAALIPLNPSMK
jgi:hypothetical protein